MKTIIIGVGSTVRGDDGVGVIAARQWRSSFHTGSIAVLELGTGGLSLLDWIQGYERLIVLDAIVTGAPPGTIHQLQGDDIARTVHLGPGHEADLPTTLVLGRKILKETMPSLVHVIAVEASNLSDFSEELSPPVQKAIPRVLDIIQQILHSTPSSIV